MLLIWVYFVLLNILCVQLMLCSKQYNFVENGATRTAPVPRAAPTSAVHSRLSPINLPALSPVVNNPVLLPAINSPIAPVIAPAAMPAVGPIVAPVLGPAVAPILAPALSPFANNPIVASFLPAVAPEIASAGPNFRPFIQPAVASFGPAIAPAVAPAVIPTVASLRPALAPAVASFGPAIAPALGPARAPALITQPTPTPTENSGAGSHRNSANSPSGGAVAASVLGSIAGFAAIVGAVLYFTGGLGFLSHAVTTNAATTTATASTTALPTAVHVSLHSDPASLKATSGLESNPMHDSQAKSTVAVVATCTVSPSAPPMMPHHEHFSGSNDAL